MIDSFQGPYRFLSNFWSAKVELDGKTYPSVENAFQAAKSVIPGEREAFAGVSPADAKKLGKKVTLRSDWEDVKLGIMRNLVEQKFRNHPVLTRQLLATGAVDLVEGNTWGDTYWGVCRGTGQNHLGKILVTVREQLRQEMEMIRELGQLPSFDPARASFTYAGVGPRKAPVEVCQAMTKVAAWLEQQGYTLLTGDAAGADEAFRAGAGRKEVFRAADATDRTRAIAREVHPNPTALSPFVLNLMARSTFQVFGRDLDAPVDFLVTHTPGGQKVGGTAQAIRLAEAKGVPVVNMALPGWREKLLGLVNENERGSDMPQEFKSKAEQKRALEDLNREYQKMRRGIQDSLLAKRGAALRVWPSEPLQDLYYDLPLDLHQWSSKRSQQFGELFDVTEIDALAAKREAVKNTPIAVKAPPKKPGRAANGEPLGLVSSLKGNSELLRALEAHKPSLVDLYRANLDRRLGSFAGRFNGDERALSRSSLAGFWRSTIRPLLDRTKEGWCFDQDKLDRYCQSVAQDTVNSWIAKIHSKMGLLDEAKVKSLDGCRFLITGSKAGRQVEIQQDMIVNQSTYGRHFNQFPARIYVDGEFYPEKRFREEFEGHDKALVGKPAAKTSSMGM